MYTLIDFYADWCGPCKIMKPVFHMLAEEYKGRVEFTEVNVEEDQQRSAEFGVMSIPTFVLLKDGQEVSRKLGAMPKDMVKAWIEENIK